MFRIYCPWLEKTSLCKFTGLWNATAYKITFSGSVIPTGFSFTVSVNLESLKFIGRRQTKLRDLSSPTMSSQDLSVWRKGRRSKFICSVMAAYRNPTVLKASQQVFIVSCGVEARIATGKPQHENLCALGKCRKTIIYVLDSIRRNSFYLPGLGPVGTVEGIHDAVGISTT